MNLDLLNPFRDPFGWRYCYHGGKSDTQKTAEANSAADRASRDKYSGTAQKTLSQFEGPVQDSPFYKALKTTGIESTSRAYDTARANMRESANLSGFGYNQPAEQGAEGALRKEEAGSLADVPTQSLLQATAPALSAASDTAGIGRGYGGDATSNFHDATTLEQQRQQNSLWNKLWSLPQAAAQGVGAYYGAGGCWIAAAVYDGWDDPRVHAVRSKLWADAGTSRLMRAVLGLYIAFGEYPAFVISRSRLLKKTFRTFLDAYVHQS